jgi:single-strand DNA-binding protein
MPDINTVAITGNLTRDPEVRPVGSTSVCRLRVAVNERVKDNATGEWGDRSNYFDVTVWGAQGENCGQYLTKGRGIAVNGRLRWREWQPEGGEKRQAVEIVADTVKFLGGGNGDGSSSTQHAGTASSEVPADPGDFAPPVPSDDDIPF